MDSDRAPDRHQKSNRLFVGPRPTPPNIFHQNSFITFWDTLRTDTQIDRCDNTTSSTGGNVDRCNHCRAYKDWHDRPLYLRLHCTALRAETKNTGVLSRLLQQQQQHAQWQQSGLIHDRFRSQLRDAAVTVAHKTFPTIFHRSRPLFTRFLPGEPSAGPPGTVSNAVMGSRPRPRYLCSDNNNNKKAVCRKETAQCHSCSFRFKVRREHSLQA